MEGIGIFKLSQYGSGTPTWSTVLSNGNFSGGTGVNPTIQGSDSLDFNNNSNTASLSTSTLTATRTYTLQDGSGTLAFLSDISSENIGNSDLTLTGNRTLTLSASNYLSFEGGETTFKGESSADDGTYVSKFLNSSSGDVFLLKNNGRASLNGTIDNNTILKISNTAELYKTGLSVDTNGGTAIVASATAASGGNAIKGTVSGGNALAVHGLANNATSFGVKGESASGYGGQFTGGTAAIVTVSGSGDIHTEGVIRYSEEPDPTAVANKGFTYCKDVSGVTELFFMRSDGTTIQLS